MDQTATTDHSTDAFGAALRRAAPWIGVLMLLVLLAGAFILETHREVTDPGDSDAIAFVTGAHLMVSDPEQLYSRRSMSKRSSSTSRRLITSSTHTRTSRWVRSS